MAPMPEEQPERNETDQQAHVEGQGGMPSLSEPTDNSAGGPTPSYSDSPVDSGTQNNMPRRSSSVDSGTQSITRQRSSSAPEPPASWMPDQASYTPNDSLQAQENRPTQETNSGEDASYRIGRGKQVVVKFSREEALRFESARKLMMSSQICALVSLFIGGVLLASVACVLAVVAYLRIRQIAEAKGFDAPLASAFKRPAVVAIVMCLIALGVNAAMLVYLYPLAMQSLNAGDFGLFTGSNGAGASNSTWG